MLARALADRGDAELEESLKIAAEHLNGARNPSSADGSALKRGWLRL